VAEKKMQTTEDKLREEIAVLRQKVDELTRKEALYNNQLEEQKYYARKMEAVGRLAGSIAHDFNNILMIVISFSDLILSELEEDHPARMELEEIKKAGERGAAITRRLLTFSSRQAGQQQLVDPIALMENLMFLIRSIAGEQIKVELHYSKPAGLIKVDARQIEQAVINLVLNARDAMPQGGVLTLGLTREKFASDMVKKYPHLYPGMYQVIAVSDTGCGMDEQVKASIFEPFFTTKANSGTGLGLATAYGFVRQNNGIILFDTSPGRGSTFKIYLPWLEEAAGSAENAVQSASGAVLTAGTIMVVEDHDTVRKMIRQSLHTDGYKILEAANAEEALAICRSSAQSIQLIISDIVMPGKSGPELVRELLAFRPATRVLFISGYKGEYELASIPLPCRQDFLQKPFSAETLLEKVHKVLEG
jgi:signal transduction histidine kinase